MAFTTKVIVKLPSELDPDIVINIDGTHRVCMQKLTEKNGTNSLRRK